LSTVTDAKTETAALPGAVHSSITALPTFALVNVINGGQLVAWTLVAHMVLSHAHNAIVRAAQLKQWFRGQHQTVFSPDLSQMYQVITLQPIDCNLIDAGANLFASDRDSHLSGLNKIVQQ
jgi:hypothetical protein